MILLAHRGDRRHGTVPELDILRKFEERPEIELPAGENHGRHRVREAGR